MLVNGMEKSIPPEIRESARKMLERHKLTTKKRSRGLSKFQRDLEDVNRRVAEARRKADGLKRKYMLDPRLRKIEGNLKRKIADSELVCPECGRPDTHNKMGGKPWCVFCNVPLVSKAKVEKWKRFPRVRVLPKSLQDELRRLNPRLNPDNKER